MKKDSGDALVLLALAGGLSVLFAASAMSDARSSSECTEACGANRVLECGREVRCAPLLAGVDGGSP